MFVISPADSGGEQSNSDSGVDQQLSPPPAAFASTPDESSVVFMGQHGFVLLSNKQTNTGKVQTGIFKVVNLSEVPMRSVDPYLKELSNG